MVEEFKYEKKRIGKDENDKGSLKNLINEEFKKIERKNGIGIRDDQEIRNAGWNTISKLIKEIQKDKNIIRGKRALEPLTKLSNNLKIEHNNMGEKESRKLITNNKDKINQIANRIDTAEKETLERLKKNRTTQNSRDIVKKGNEMHKDKPMFIMEGGNDVKKQTGNIIFTEASNPVRIDQALKGLFDNPNIVYEIDYSNCDTSTARGKAIKEKMTKLIGAKTCYLRYDKDQKTYTIRDKDGNGISDRAYIRQGVKLIPAGVRQRQAYVKEKNENEELLEGDNSLNGRLDMLKYIPSAAKELNRKEQKILYKNTDKRIVELLKKAKSLGYEIDPECITKKWLGSGQMELHLNSGSSETSRTFWENETQVGGEKLYDFIDENEGEYKDYLTKRVKEIRLGLDRLTKVEITNVGIIGQKKGREKLTNDERKREIEKEKERKQKILYGIGLLEKMIDNYRESEGDSRDNDDRDLIQIKKLIRDSKASINQSDILDDDAINKNFIEPIRSKWSSIKRIQKTINTGQGQIYDNPAYKEQYNQLKNVFFGEKDNQISAIRSLGGNGRLFDNTETSFLAEEIEQNNDLTVKNKDIKECINNIKIRLSDGIFDKNGNINQKRKEQFDKMFTYAAKGTDTLISLLVNSKMLPKNWKNEEDEVRKCVDTLKSQLNQINKESEGFTYTISTIRKREHKEKLSLEQKANKSEEDIKRLQVLTYLENNPNDPAVKESYEKTIQYMKYESKYGNLGSITKSCLFPALAELGGGAEGTNADIYNDIKGYGFWNLSDENAKYRSEEIIEDIIVEVVVTAVAIALSECGAGEAIYVSFRVAKAAAKGAKGLKRVIKGAELFGKTLGKKMATQYAAKFSVKSAKAAKEITKASHIATSTRKGVHGLARIEDAYRTIKATETFGSLSGKLALKGTSMIIEGTTFHINSTIIHNAIEGKDLTEGLNPFGYTKGPNGEKISNFRNYAQSIAFLGVLKTIGKPIQGLTGNMAKGILREKYDVNTLAKMFRNGMSMTGEMGSMIGTDEILSLTFDQKFKPITAEDFVTMFGMVAGLRLTNKVNVKIQEYDKNSVTLEMKQGDNIFNVKIDGEGNVLKIDGKDKNGNRISNPENVLGIKSGIEGNNLRETHSGKEVGTLEGNIGQLNRLQEGDIITVKHGENDVKFKKDKDGNREIVDAGNIENDWFIVGEKYIVKENSDGLGYHLETKTAGGPKISLDGKVGVKLGTHAYVHNELRYESGLSEDEQTLLAEQFDNNLNGDGIKIDGNIYTMKLEGSIYTIYKNGEEIAKGLGHETSVNGKESLILPNSDTNINFLNTYNKIRTEYLIREEVNIKLSNKFYNELKSENGITIDGINYKLKYLTSKINSTTGHKGTLVYTETDIKTGKEIRKSTIQSSSFDIPTGSNGDRIKEQINKQKDKYTKDNFQSEYEVMKSKVTEITVENPIDIRELTKRGRYEIEMEYILNGLDEQLIKFIENHGEKYDFSEFKESAIKAGQFIEGIYNWIKKIPSKPNVKIPKDFLRNLGIKIKEVTNKRGNQLSEYQKKIKEKINKFLEKKLSEKGDEVEISNEEIDNLDNNDDTSSLGERREKLSTFEEKFKFLSKNFHIDGLTKAEIESLTKGQIIRLKELYDIGFSISFNTIDKIKLTEQLTKDQMIKLKELHDLGFSLSIETIDLLKLTNNEINTLKQLKDLGVNLNSYTDEISKIIPEQINTLKQLKDLGVDLSSDIREISKFTPEQISTLKQLKNLGVDLSSNVESLSKITPEQINTLKQLKDLGIDISDVFPTYGRNLIDLKPEEINTLKQLKDLGVDLSSNVESLSKLTSEEIKKLKDINGKLGYLNGNLNMYLDLTSEQIKKLVNLKKLGIKFDGELLTLQYIDNLSEYEISTIENKINEIENSIRAKEKEIQKLEKEIMNKNNEIKLFKSKNNKRLKKEIENNKIQIKNLKDIKNILKNTNIQEFKNLSKVISEIIPSKNDIKKYIDRKNKFLEKYETLSQDDFNELFRINTGRDKNGKKKYGRFYEINQESLGYCYAYTGFELLKKSNFFDVLIRTSIKKTSAGREVKLPLGDPKGHIIKVNEKNEINKIFDFSEVDKNEPPEKRRDKVCINSDTSLGFKILEIAFIKEYIIHYNEYEHETIAQNARTEYENTGDIALTSELLKMVEGGRTPEFLEYILNKNMISYKETELISDKEKKLAYIKCANMGNIKIALRREEKTKVKPNKFEIQEGNERFYFNKNTAEYEIAGNHAFSIEKTYYDPVTKQNMVIVVNPRATGEKIHITATDCINLFDFRVSLININNAFK